MSQILLFTCSPVTYTLWQLARITQAFQVIDNGKSECSLYGRVSIKLCVCAVTVGFYVLSRRVCLIVIDDDFASFSNAGSVDLFQFWCVVQCPRQRVSLNCHCQLLTVLTLLILDLCTSGYSSLLGASESTVSRVHMTKQRVFMQHKLSCSWCLLSHLVLYPYSL